MCKADTPTVLAVLTALRLYRVSVTTERERFVRASRDTAGTGDPIETFTTAMIGQCQQQIEAIDRLCASVTKPAYSEAVVKACRAWAENYLLTIK